MRLKIPQFIIFVCLLIAIYYLNVVGQTRQARYNIEVLERYIQAVKILENRFVESLAELPDYEIISPYDSLSLNLSRLRSGILEGYHYDLQYLGNGQFVISASPFGFFSSGMEFGITDEGILKVNNENIDFQVDDYKEVSQWKAITKMERIRSKNTPEYLN